jgi:hypothetical protein
VAIIQQAQSAVEFPKPICLLFAAVLRFARQGLLIAVSFQTPPGENERDVEVNNNDGGYGKITVITG